MAEITFNPRQYVQATVDTMTDKIALSNTGCTWYHFY